MSLKSLINDPQFSQLSSDDQKKAVLAVEPNASQLNDQDYSTFVNSLKTDQNPNQSLVKGNSIMAQHKTQGLFGTTIGQDSPLVKFFRDMASNSRQGLRMGTNLIPDAQTQSVPLNIALNTPKTLAEIGSDISASSLEPESILTAGALEGGKLAAPAINAAGRTIGEGAEKLSGIHYDTPGALAETTQDPLLPFRHWGGTEAVSDLYAKKFDPNQIRESLKSSLGNKDFVSSALEAAKETPLTPEEALAARQSLDAIKNSVPRVNFFQTRQMLNDIAKTKFAPEDAAYAQAVKAENLRNLLPLNKTGTPSIVKTALGIGGAMEGKRSAYNYLLAPAMSPFLQSLATSGIGMARQGLAPALQNPGATGIGLSALLNRKR